LLSPNDTSVSDSGENLNALESGRGLTCLPRERTGAFSQSAERLRFLSLGLSPSSLRQRALSKLWSDCMGAPGRGASLTRGMSAERSV